MSCLILVSILMPLACYSELTGGQADITSNLGRLFKRAELIPMDPRAPDVQEALWFAVKRMNKFSKRAYIFKPVKINKVTRKVLRDMTVFRFNGVQMAATQCTKSDPPPQYLIESCRVNTWASASTDECDFLIMDQSWREPFLYDVMCRPVQTVVSETNFIK